jgi:hypothetical protein
LMVDVRLKMASWVPDLCSHMFKMVKSVFENY